MSASVAPPSNDGRNEVKARQGIDTHILQRCHILQHLRRNEVKARQGIDTFKSNFFSDLEFVVEMQVKPDRALTHIRLCRKMQRIYVEMQVKPDRALTQVSGKVYRILVIVEMKVKPVRALPHCV